MTVQHIMLALLGTAICLAGFFKWPKSSYELLRPRFAVPLLICGSTFIQVFSYYQQPSEGGIYQASRELSGVIALQFLIFCMLAFWVGFALPIGRSLAHPLTGITGRVPINGKVVRHVGYMLCVTSFLFLLVFAGPVALGIGRSGGLFGGTTLSKVGIARLVLTMSTFGSALVGMGWPAKGEPRALATVLGLTCLLLTSMPYMATFSRGSGMPVAIAAIAFGIRHRRFSIVALLLAGLWGILCSHAGLIGRGVHGHYGGVNLFLHYLVTVSAFSGSDLITVGLGATDSFTPLCVTIRATEATYVGQLTPLKWLLFQVPLPRVFNFHPEWTFDLPIFLGGAGSWGYTPGLFGDAYGHFGFTGAFVLFVMGIVYRMVDTATLDLDDGGGLDSINPNLALLFLSYLALFMGLFNTFRSWVVAFSYPLYLLTAVLVLKRFLRPRPQSGAEVVTGAT